MSGKLPFRSFDERTELCIRQSGFLPHWSQPGCTYFVTFRLADSVPQPILDQWRYDRDKWLDARGIDPNAATWTQAFKQLSREDRRLFKRHFARKLFEYLDKGCGACHLRNPQVARIVADAISYFHDERLNVGDFVIMPNHVHALITPYSEYDVEGVLHSVKSFSANRINEALGRSGTLWMGESYDHIVRDGEELLRIQEYIRRNPEKANLKAGEFILHEAEYTLT